MFHQRFLTALLPRLVLTWTALPPARTPSAGGLILTCLIVFLRVSTPLRKPIGRFLSTGVIPHHGYSLVSHRTCCKSCCHAVWWFTLRIGLRHLGFPRWLLPHSGSSAFHAPFRLWRLLLRLITCCLLLVCLQYASFRPAGCTSRLRHQAPSVRPQTCRRRPQSVNEVAVLAPLETLAGLFTDMCQSGRRLGRENCGAV